MTRDDDRDRIRPVGGADGPAGVGTPYGHGHLTVTYCRTCGDLPQRLPDAALERRAAGRDLNGIERSQVAGEISVERRGDVDGGGAIFELVIAIVGSQQTMHALFIIGEIEREVRLLRR